MAKEAFGSKISVLISKLIIELGEVLHVKHSIIWFRDLYTRKIGKL